MESQNEKSDGSIGAENKGLTATQYPTSFAYQDYGANNDLWSESWEYTDINDVDFGVVLSTTLGFEGQGYAYVDHMRITVYYSEEAPSDCWTETAGKIIIPPDCKYYTNTKEFIVPS